MDISFLAPRAEAILRYFDLVIARKKPCYIIRAVDTIKLFRIIGLAIYKQLKILGISLKRYGSAVYKNTPLCVKPVPPGMEHNEGSDYEE
jgi:hypothetical protein